MTELSNDINGDSAQGILDKRGRKSMSQSIFYVFVPALVFVKVGEAVDLSNFARWWSLPMNVIVRCGQHA